MATKFSFQIKRVLDVLFSGIGLLLLGWLILVAAFIAYLDIGENGFFVQERIGKAKRRFKLYKIKSMRPVTGVDTTITNHNDPRISATGKFWRKTKIDELPQLWNVFKGDMSFVGPRPDVQGFADVLTGDDRVILKVKPGVTGPATLKYKNEEEILAMQSNPESYNRTIIWPDKVEINKKYVYNWSFYLDLNYILQSLIN